MREIAEQLVKTISQWKQLNRYFHEEDAKYLRFLVPAGLRILELGCGSGWLLDQLAPREGVGVDFSPAMIERARVVYPQYRFLVGDIEDEALIKALDDEPFDIILIADTIGLLEDVQTTLAQLHRLCTPQTRLIVTYHSVLWFPILKLAERLRLKMPSLSENWLSTDDIANLLRLSGFSNT